MNRISLNAIKIDEIHYYFYNIRKDFIVVSGFNLLELSILGVFFQIFGLFQTNLYYSPKYIGIIPI